MNVEGKAQAQFASGEAAYLLALGCAVGENTYSDSARAYFQN